MSMCRYRKHYAMTSSSWPTISFAGATERASGWPSLAETIHRACHLREEWTLLAPLLYAPPLPLLLT